MQDELNEDFVAIKTGDVNLTSLPNFVPQTNEDLAFVMGQPTTVGNGLIQIDVKAKNHNNISAWQLDLSFDHYQMDFEKIEKADLPGFNESNTGERFLENGILPIVWINPSGASEGLTIEDGTVLFSLKFRMRSNLPFSKDWFGIATNRIQKSAFRDIEPLNINLLFEENTPNVEEWKVSKFYPNPFANETVVEFILPQKEEVHFQVFDISGKVVYTQDWREFEKGENKIELSGIFLPSAGVYYYKLRTTQNHAEGKIIFTK